jgi:hypothetical protein
MIEWQKLNCISYALVINARYVGYACLNLREWRFCLSIDSMGHGTNSTAWFLSNTWPSFDALKLDVEEVFK